MLLLTFVGCGYSLAEDDMTKYADFSNEDKAKFEAKLKEIFIEDGDFTSDPAKREKKVLEKIYEDIAKAVKDDADKETEGTPGEHDVVYYSYYATAVVKDVLRYFYVDKMKSGSPASVQLRPYVDDGKDVLAEKIAEAIKTHDFSKYVYSSVTSGKTVAGDVAFVTYTKTVGTEEPVTYTNQMIVIGEAPAENAEPTSFASYLSDKSIASTIEKKEIDGATYSSIKINWVSSRETTGTANEGDKVYVSYKKQVGDAEATTVTKEALIVGAAVAEGETAANLESYLAGKKIAKTLDNLTLTEGETEIKYTNIKIDWRANNAEAAATVVDTTFDEKTELTDTNGEKHDLKDVELTYYVYPVYYTSIPKYSAEVLIDKVLGEDLTADSIYEILFVKKIADLGDDATEEQRKEIKDEGAPKYKYKTETEELSIEDIVNDILDYYDEIEAAQTNIDKREDELDEAEANYDKAKTDYDAEKAKGDAADADKLAELEEAFKKADEALNGKLNEADGSRSGGAKANLEKAETEYDKIGEEKTANIKKLLSITGEGETETLETVLAKNYKIVTYDYLQLVYNEEIKNKLATEIYFFLTENIKVKDELPEKAVKEAYTQMYETIESDFYTGTYDTTKKISNYKQYSGNFDKFLIDEVNELCKDDDGFVKVETVKAAKAALDAKARESVKPLVEIFLAAQVYDLVLTDKEYEEYKDELEEYYYYYVLYYKNFSIESMLGKTNMKTAAQFNKIMDWILDYDKDTAEADENGYKMITYKYKHEQFGEYIREYKIGDPASKAEKSE